MKRYVVYLTATASHAVEVEAESVEEALGKADQIGVPTLCHQCSSHMDLGDFMVDEQEVEEFS